MRRVFGTHALLGDGVRIPYVTRTSVSELHLFEALNVMDSRGWRIRRLDNDGRDVKLPCFVSFVLHGFFEHRYSTRKP